MATNEEIKELSIKTLFDENDEYLIPIYQRNYAWTKTEVEQLVMDIHGYSNKEQNYYIGTLVVFEKVVNNKKVFETIDGQQRLTTLSILLSVLKNEYTDSNLTFNSLLKYESREISTDTLKYIYQGNLEIENLNPGMKNAYKTIKNYLKNNLKDIDKFKDYLLDKVIILRVNVPKDTDLNHYFETMNNRGEQLEKHEVLKARMMEKLPDDGDKKLFNDIWEACSDMSRYVQYGFTTDLRDKIFSSEWNSFVCNNFDGLKNESKTQKSQDVSVDDIIGGKCNIETTNEKKDDDTPDRFTSPINFSNFLLHILKVITHKQTSLDDKGLLDAFSNLNKEFVKEFGFNLLKMRFLLDNYVIKREYTNDKDEWSLKQAYKYTNENTKQKNVQYKNRFDDENLNKKILMILSMFHVSNPSQIYKYWLTGTLNFIFFNYCEKGIDADLNHYFEIMNNRGVQLEKHEVLKARMIEKLSDDTDKKLFNDIWEACSDMSRYVQYGFTTDLRDKIFRSEWNSFVCNNFDGLKNESKTQKSQDVSVDDIIGGKCNIETTTSLS